MAMEDGPGWNQRPAECCRKDVTIMRYINLHFTYLLTSSAVKGEHEVHGYKAAI